MDTLSFTVAGAILAGGQSRRMGQDKACLRLGEKTLLERAQALLAACGCSPILLCGNREDALPDRYPDAGPLAGLDSALQYTLAHKLHGLLLIPVDMPLLDDAVLKPLIRAGTANNGCTHYQHHPLPLYCTATPALVALCEQLLDKPDPRQHALHVFASAAKALALNADNARGKLDNINTPDDWQRLLAARKDGS